MNYYVKMMNMGANLVLLIIFSIILWSNKDKIAKLIENTTDNIFFAYSTMIGIGFLYLLVLLIVIAIVHKLNARIFR